MADVETRQTSSFATGINLAKRGQITCNSVVSRYLKVSFQFLLVIFLVKLTIYEVASLLILYFVTY
jgi:hypothetical protein